MTERGGEVAIRPTDPRDFAGIAEMTAEVYPWAVPWTERELASHRRVFPEGQLVATLGPEERVVGMAASLIVTWDDYETADSWWDLTADGLFTNHDPTGRTLYGAEVMVRPGNRGRGIGTALYEARRELCRRVGLPRIRAGARLTGYGRHADEMSAEEYVRRVVAGELDDPTLSFQIRHDFHVLHVVSGYLPKDPESHGWAAIIEWLDPELATPGEIAAQRRRFG